MTEMRWSSRFLSERRQARRYRVGPGVPRRRRRPRALAAGRAGDEHRHRRCDEPGLEARRGRPRHGPGRLLDSYQAERHPVGTRVLRLTDAFNKLVLGTSAFRRAFRRVAVTAILALPVRQAHHGRSAQWHRHQVLPAAGRAPAGRHADARRRLWPSAAVRAAAHGSLRADHRLRPSTSICLAWRVVCTATRACPQRSWSARTGTSRGRRTRRPTRRPSVPPSTGGA